MRLPFRRTILLMVLTLASMPFAISAAQTPVPMPPGGEWWTAWSSCDITPVQYGPAPENIPGTPDSIYWLQGETTSESDIDMIVWLWTGNRPLPLDGVYASDGTFTKWLWAFSEPMRDIIATVTNERGTEGEVQFGGEILSSTTGPINGWPSYAIAPEPGCWTFEITATALDGEIYQGRVIFPAVP
jgi:hypothetical protein